MSTDGRPGDESTISDGEVKAYLHAGGYSVLTAKEYEIHRKLGPEGQRKRDDHPIKLVVQGSISDYHSRAREWRSYGDQMHQRAMAAERELKLYRERFGTLTTPGAEPIPPGIYYSRSSDNFYGAKDAKGQGTAFYIKWADRRFEFPASGTDCQ